MLTILIKNGLVYDGSGREPLKADILVRGERIASIGNFGKRQADKTIDAQGALVAPGFIDINSECDHSFGIFLEPYQRNYIKQGVTTVIGGNRGISLAPVSRAALDFMKDWLGSFPVNINWHSVKDFLRVLQKRGLGVNFGTVVGSTTIRQSVVGDGDRDLTDNEIGLCKKILGRSFDDGAFGFSDSGGLPFSKNEHFYEITAFAKIAAAKNRVYAANFKNIGDEILDLVGEKIKIAKETGVSIEINNFQPIKNLKKEYEEFKDVIEKEIAQTHVNFDCHPFEYLLLPIYDLLPSWVKGGNFKATIDYLNSVHLKNRLIEHFKKMNFADFFIYRVPETFKVFTGKNLKDISVYFNLKPTEALLKLMKITNLRIFLIHKNVDAKTLHAFMSSPNSIISGGGFDLSGNGDFDAFPKFINWAGGAKNFPLEKAIAKITSAPVKKYNIRKRGLIKENYYADIVILRDFKPTEVLVNGRLALIEGRVQNILPGAVLKPMQKNAFPFS